MSIGWLRPKWNAFFFEEQSPVPLALFRIVYGLLVMTTLLLLYPDWLAWYGRHAWISLDTMQTLEPSRRINLFTILPQSDAWIKGFYWVALSSAAMLAAGFLTRVNSLIVFVCLASVQQRNLFITHGGDTFLRLAGFFLIFAPAGAALSVDRLIRVRRGMESAIVRPRRPWAQRMIQIQLALLYFSSFCWKLKGSGWLNGTTLFYIYHLDSLHRFPLPGWLFHSTVLKLASWAALAIEFSLGVLVWIRRIRYYVLACGLVLHLWLEYSLNIPLFQWDVLSAYILFLDPADPMRIWNWIRRRAHRTEEPERAPSFSD
jgi:hypothetical protein